MNAQEESLGGIGNDNHPEIDSVRDTRTTIALETATIFVDG